MNSKLNAVSNKYHVRERVGGRDREYFSFVQPGGREKRRDTGKVDMIHKKAERRAEEQNMVTNSTINTERKQREGGGGGEHKVRISGKRREGTRFVCIGTMGHLEVDTSESV